MFVTTFGSSRLDDKTKEYQEGVMLGRFFAAKGFVVKCGGYGGLMEAVSRGVYEEGGRCIGFGVEHFEAIRPKNPYIKEMVVCKSLFERVERLIEGSSLFVVQKGDIGTLNELFLVWCLKYAGISQEFRICVIGEEFKDLYSLRIIDRKNFDMLEFFKDGEDFINKAF